MISIYTTEDTGSTGLLQMAQCNGIFRVLKEKEILEYQELYIQQKLSKVQVK